MGNDEQAVVDHLEAMKLVKRVFKDRKFVMQQRSQKPPLFVHDEDQAEKSEDML